MIYLKNIVIFLIAFCPATISLAQSIDMKRLCPEASPSTLSYQKLFIDHKDPEKRSLEVWIDEGKDKISGYIFDLKAEKSYYLSGEKIGKNEFFLCKYENQSTKPSGLYLAVYSANALELHTVGSKTAKPIKLLPGPSIDESRSFGFRQEMHEIVHSLPGRVPEGSSESCLSVASFFQLVEFENAAMQKRLNQRITSLYENLLAPGLANKECLALKKFPRKRSLRIDPMYASNRYLSIKLDHSTIEPNRGNLTGDGINIDLSNEKELILKDLLAGAYEKNLIALLKKRLQVMTGTSGRFENLKDVHFSFTRQTLVISFAPVDQQGWYLPTYHIDIPIPLDRLRAYFNKKGPFKGGLSSSVP